MRARSLLLPLALAAAAAALAATAGAQELIGDERDPNQPTTVDTGFTPLAKENPDWKLIAGASFGATELPEKRAAVPFDVDFYTVSFRHAKKGFIGGAKCRESIAGEELRALKQAGADCDRVPVIYQFTDNDGEGQILKPAYVADAEADVGGYVGAIAWIDSDTALAVGGDGSYPHRARERPAAGDPAGSGRAWLFENGNWRELDDLPDDMRGLSALALHPGGDLYRVFNHVDEGAIGYAGGEGQLWKWSTAERRFVKGFDAESPESDLQNGASFRFRVRSIAFQLNVKVNDSDITTPDPDVYSVLAVTAGCCAPNPAHDFPRRLTTGYGKSKSSPLDRWTVLDTDKGANDLGESRPFSYYALYSGPPRRDLGEESAPLTAIVNPDGPPPAPGSPNHPEPPSFVGPPGPKGLPSPIPRPTSWLERADVDEPWWDAAVCGASASHCVRTPGSPTRRGRFLSTTRLVSLDSRWAVGALASGQAAAQDGPTPTLHDSSMLLAPSQSTGPSKLYKLRTYGLNAVDAVADTGIYWAVGDHGAVLNLGEGLKLATDDPQPPLLGTRRRASLSDRAPYDQFVTVAEEVNEVPPLAEQPIEALPEPTLVPAMARPTAPGEDPQWLVMSRDGSEGWASAYGKLLHFADGLWRECDPKGLKVQTFEAPPDPACAGMTDTLVAAARVPYENAQPAAEPDRFEVVALTATTKSYRYRDGAWKEEPPEYGCPICPVLPPTPTPGSGPYSIAFAAPDDGWAIGGYDRNADSSIGSDQNKEDGRQTPILNHFDGERWIPCAPPEPPLVMDRSVARTRCYDVDDRLPFRSIESRTIGFNASTGAVPPRVLSVGTRVYFYGTRAAPDPQGQADPAGRRWPIVVFREHSSTCNMGDRTGCWTPAYDPGCASVEAGSCVPSADQAEQGRLQALSMIDRQNAYEGWATVLREAGAAPLRLRRDGTIGHWSEPEGSPGSDYGFIGEPDGLLALGEGTDDWGGALAISPPATDQRGSGPLLRLDAEEGRFSLADLPFATRGRATTGPAALAADNRGGAFVLGRGAHPFVYRYTRERRKPVFEEVPSPLREQISATAAGPDGSFWVATASNVLYRYDRRTGWDRVAINGWDPGSIVTSGSPVNALAVGPDGGGVAVGNDGRIATLDANGVVLDRAAGTVCQAVPTPPCGTSRNLVAAAVAPDGSALVAGEGRALLWRPALGEFRSVPKPFLALSATITAASMPIPTRAYLATSTGEVFRGELRTGDSDGNWVWQLENRDANDNYVTRVDQRTVIGLERMEVDASGHGYALGEGVVFERSGDGPYPWRRLKTDFGALSVALPKGRGDGVLFGDPTGLIMTQRAGRFEPARLGDPSDPTNHVLPPYQMEARTTPHRGAVIGLALLPGPEDGQVEAWAALRNGTLLHYASDPKEPLLNPAARAEPLPDAPPARTGETTFAAFGKSDCFVPESEPHPCPPMTYLGGGPGIVANAVLERATRPGGPQFALFTGDAADGAGTAGPGTVGAATPVDESEAHRRWRELVAERLTEGGLPLVATVGGQDLSTTEVCNRLAPPFCHGSRTLDGAGPSLAWRRAMAPMPAPWGRGAPASSRGLVLRPVDSASSVSTPDAGDVTIDDPDPSGLTGWVLPSRKLSTRPGARTHYAFDVIDPNGTPGEQDDIARARVVVVDSSMRSLAASDPFQDPLEPRGGQAAWLEQMLCLDGSDSDAGDARTRDCTRHDQQVAIVLTNTPTYSYGPGYQDPSANTYATAISNPGRLSGETQPDGAAFEAILLRNRASVVVSGRLGWNGLYWATAPGLHEPCPGDDYQTEVPEPGARVCGRSSEELPVDATQTSDAAQMLAGALRGAGAPLPSHIEEVVATDDGLTGVLPFVVASSAGGRFGGEGEQGTARAGYWRGYTMVRLAPGGDPRETIVEQRPVFNWIELTAAEHTLRPGQRLTLRGRGREAITNDLSASRGDPVPVRFDEIDSPAITHRYDLVLADPQRPYLPLEDANGDYVPVPAQVATVDRQTGRVRTGKGTRERTYAIAILSVGEKAASWPLVFEPRRSFAAQRQRFELPLAARAARAPAAQPPVRLAEAFPPPPAAPPAAPGSPLATQTLQPPQPPALPSLPAVTAAAPPAPPALNAPPPPPPPPPPPNLPPQQQPQPLALGAKLQAISIVPTVNPPAPPPVNPAPPAGSAARKEAKQRQAATAKSEEGTGQQAAEGQSKVNSVSDHTDGSTRHAPERDAFTRREPTAGPSAAARTALYGGGLTLAALLLATTYGLARPTPRNRRHTHPDPAPARASITIHRPR